MNISLRRIAANTGWLLAGKGVGAILSLFYIAIATRTLGLHDFGVFALIVGIGQTVTGFVTFQTWQLVVRYGVPLLDEPDRAGLHALVRFAIGLDVKSALAGSVIAVGAVYGLAPRFGWTGELQWQASLFCLALLLSIRSTPIGILRLRDRYARSTVADAVTPIVRLAGALLAWLAAPGVEGMLLAWAVAELATAAAYWILALRIEPLTFGRAMAPAGAWQFVLSTNATSTLALSSRQVMLLGVGIFAGPAAAGGYRVAAQLSQSLAKLTGSVSRTLFPEFVQRLRDGSRAELRRLSARIMGASLLTGAVAVAVAAVLGQPLIRAIAGPGFESAYRPVLLLTIAAAIDLVSVTFEPLLVAAGRSGRALGLRLIATVLQFAALFILATALGAIGAAWATLFGSLVAMVITGTAALQVIRDRRPTPIAA